MKFSIEIKDETFLYEYEIGKSREVGESPLGLDTYILFAAVLKQLGAARNAAFEDRKNKALQQALEGDWK